MFIVDKNLVEYAKQEGEYNSNDYSLYIEESDTYRELLGYEILEGYLAQEEIWTYFSKYCNEESAKKFLESLGFKGYNTLEEAKKQLN